MEGYEDVLSYWFGRVEQTIVPTSNRREIWFGDNKQVDEEIRHRFGKLFERATNGELEHWRTTPRQSLALVIMLDQFSRHIYRGLPQAYMFDEKALQVCLQGLEQEMDHALSSIERVFYYLPLIHCEDIEMQTIGVSGYQLLVELVLSETKGVYEDFLEYAMQHYRIIQQFGRFPHRNEVLGRKSTEEEVEFLREYGDYLKD